MSQSEDGDANRTFMATDSEELVVRNEEFGVDNANFDTNDFVVAATNKELVNLENACVNIDNSSDVIFGSVKHYHVNGNLTIFQNRDASIEGDDEHQAKLPNGIQNVQPASDSLRQETNEAFTIPKKLPLKLYVGVVLGGLIFVIFIVLLGFYLKSLSYNSSNPTDSSDTPITSKPNETPSNQPIPKKVWNGGRESSAGIPMKTPIDFVIIKHTAGGTCFDFVSCAKKLQTIFSMNIEQGLDDIYCSFLIGGDGNVYEGRGFNVQPQYRNNSIDIVYMGNYSVDKFTPVMINSTLEFLAFAVKINKLTPNYKLVAHNQTENQISPGKNVFKVIKTWPHYDSGLYFKSSFAGSLS